MATAKTIQLFLANGKLDGILTISEPDWIGKIISAPRDNFDQLLHRPEVSNAGVYFLLSDTKVYIGQSQSSIKSRLQQHDRNKDWWHRVIFLTHTSNAFTSTDVQYFEQKFIKLASEAGTNTENQTVGNKFNIDEWNQANDDKFIDEVLLLFGVIGIHVFDKKRVNETKIEQIEEFVEVKTKNLSEIRRPQLIELIQNEYHKNPKLFHANIGINTHPAFIDKTINKVKLYDTPKASGKVKTTREIAPGVHVFVNYSLKDIQQAYQQYQTFFEKYTEE